MSGVDAGIGDKSCVWWPHIGYPLLHDFSVSNVDYFMKMFFNYIYKNSLLHATKIIIASFYVENSYVDT